MNPPLIKDHEEFEIAIHQNIFYLQNFYFIKKAASRFIFKEKYLEVQEAAESLEGDKLELQLYKT